MARGPRSICKRLAAPKAWMLAKLGGDVCSSSIQWPTQIEGIIALDDFLRNRLKYALNGAEYKLCKVRKTQLGAKGVPFVVTHDGRTIVILIISSRANDTVQVDIATGKITDYIKFDFGLNTHKICNSA
ncbi:unnamed protein product [Ceratitis capitata]|uniref:(Mediterranean fruit fly) hypothetical protein n=1 Tax=Ceratitis capitata TaxID=7213 RepID=A0A811V3K5_CERCA|nr:unnamed protein product [Ceratitis capitata]